ncbi:MAG: hypothetical protein CME39_04140 [Haliea sp.]|nr:hypothetical protein [Haliea sp.]|tara:strand:+ start:1057 stop:1410 length:354 start_codon:yes stop_codon:yes gene_type:complete
MVELLKEMGVALGVFVTLLALIGGLLSLPAQIRRFRLQLRPRGDRGTQYFLMSRHDTSESTIVEFLVVEDLMHFLGSWGKAGGGATTLEIESVGEYYRVKLQYPSGALDAGYQKVKK